MICLCLPLLMFLAMSFNPSNQNKNPNLEVINLFIFYIAELNVEKNGNL